MEHHAHYVNAVVEGLLLEEIGNHRLTRPCFVGQGWTKSVGSDCYGGYIVSHHQVGRKEVWGLVEARTEFGPAGWTAGSMDCCLPNNKDNPTDCQPTSYITQSGVWKNSNLPKFYFCDKNGKKFNGRKCCYNWNGASSYRDPSF